jgi:hypothetical protein
MRGTKAGRFLLMGLLGAATALGAASSARADDRHYQRSGRGSGQGYYSQGHRSYGYHGQRGHYRSHGSYGYSRPYYGGGYYRPYGYGYGYGYGNGYGYGYGNGYGNGYGYAYAPPPVYVPYRPYCGPRVGVGLSLGFGF